ncbi:MAG TPA: MFS transporter [Candidatus Saccharimonadales bacterium]|nr:MFS transporter [Candidatus Saccharimonadales bacterium]
MVQKLPAKIYKQFPALQYKNYRLYFFGQLVSFTGSWLHGVAHGWLVYQLTHSPFWLGAVSAISALPVLVLSLYGGFLVDRVNRKKLLLCTQTASLILAFILGILTITHMITLPILFALTLLAGIANAIDNPTTQAFVVDVVGKEDLPSAVGLNATMFNTGKVLGPATAGFLIALVGVGNIFLINAASFLAILVSLYFIEVHMKVSYVKEQNPIGAIKEGLIYAFSHPLLLPLLLTAAIGAIFCFSQATIMPVIAETIFKQGTQGLGMLLSATGLGALIGSVYIGSHAKKISAAWRIAIGNIVFILSTMVFTFITNVELASICLFFSGLGLTLQFSSVYSSIQKLVKEEFRGRVSSIYVLLFIGLSPLGNLLIGSMTSWIGPQLAIRFCLSITSLYALIMMLHLPNLRRKYIIYGSVLAK